MARLAAAARAAGAPLLANVDARQSGRGIYKSALLVGPAGVLGSFDKLRLVPFGEYVPLRPLFGWVTRLTDAAAVDRHRGARLAVLPAGAQPLSPLVYFKSAFPDLAKDLAADGADLVVVQTADTTFQGSWGLDQHASLSAVRAVEAGRPVRSSRPQRDLGDFGARGRRLAWAPGSWPGRRRVPVGGADPLCPDRRPRPGGLRGRPGRQGDPWPPGGARSAAAVAGVEQAVRPEAPARPRR